MPCEETPHRALECAFSGYEIDERERVGVEVEVAALRATMQAAGVVSAGW